MCTWEACEEVAVRVTPFSHTLITHLRHIFSPSAPLVASSPHILFSSLSFLSLSSSPPSLLFSTLPFSLPVGLFSVILQGGFLSVSDFAANPLQKSHCSRWCCVCIWTGLLATLPRPYLSLHSLSGAVSETAGVMKVLLCLGSTVPTNMVVPDGHGVHLDYITWYSLKHRIWHTNNDTTSGMLCMQHREQVEWGQTWQVCVTLCFQTCCYVSAVTALEQASMLLVLAYIYWRRSLGVGRTLSVALMMKFHLLPSISQRSLQILRCSKFSHLVGAFATLYSSSCHRTSWSTSILLSVPS